MTRIRRFWPARVPALACFAFISGCSLVIGTLPEGVEPGDAGGVGGTGAAGAAGAGSGGTGPCAKPCDCDDDGALAAGGACGGDDCDDADARAHLGQSGYFDTPAPTAGFDFDCDGSTLPSETTALDCGVGIAVCPPPTQQGFVGTLPACGQAGDWGFCSNDGVVCKKSVVEQRTQKCH